MPKTKGAGKKRSEAKPGLGNIEPGSIEYWDLVRERAYHIWQERFNHNLPGDECSDWLRAEEEIDSMLADSRKAYSRRKK